MTKRLTQYILDAFTQTQFCGNTAAVIVLDSWLSNDLMLKIAQQNHLSETAFLTRRTNDWHIRWFSPIKEIDFCGHATLASAYVLKHIYQDRQSHGQDQLHFYCDVKGEFTVRQLNQNRYELNFPNECPERIVDIPENLIKGLSLKPKHVYRNQQAYFALYECADDVEHLQIEVDCIKKLGSYDVVATAVGKDNQSDFVCRYFWPANGGIEDPATGSIHAGLFPFWAKRLNKNHLISHQISPRLGILRGEISASQGRVLISGDVVLYSESRLFIQSN